MATNADTAVDDSTQVTEDDLRSLKYDNAEVETSTEEDETADTDNDSDDTEETGEDDGQTDDQTTDEDSEDDSTDDSSDETSEFVKELPSIKGDNLVDYARNLEKAYQNSTAEALRLKKLVDEAQTTDTAIGETTAKTEVDVSNPVSLYMKQKMDEEITSAYTEFSKHYPQVTDQMEYNKFTHEVATLSQTILQSQKRLAPPAELYSKAAVILGWEPDESSGAVTNQEKLKIALKTSAATSKTSSAGGKRSSKSKVSDAMVIANRRMYPDKTDAQIREELEPFVQ